MDGIEGITPNDALFMIQGSAVTRHTIPLAGTAFTGNGGSSGHATYHAYGLSPGKTLMGYVAVQWHHTDNPICQGGSA